jgi:hypothetical protein
MSAVPLVSARSPRWAIFTVVSVLGLYAASRYWLEQVTPGSMQAILAALLPLPALLYVYTAWVLQALRGDELERRIAHQGLAIGFGFTFAVVAVLGQLEKAVPPSALWTTFSDVAIIALASTFLGVALSRRKYE